MRYLLISNKPLKTWLNREYSTKTNLEELKNLVTKLNPQLESSAMNSKLKIL